jgi:hypothetical protein
MAQPIRVSFEFFPPKTEEMEKNLWEAVARLAPLTPNFVSVTYGAGGSTRERTHATVKRILAETPLTPAAHLTCVAATCDEIDGVIDIDRMALRRRTQMIDDIIRGVDVSGNGSLEVDVVGQTFTNRISHFGPLKVTVSYKCSTTAIEVRAVDTRANFDLVVGCRVTDESITGNVLHEPEARPAATAGFLGVELSLDPKYKAAKAACFSRSTATSAALRSTQASHSRARSSGGWRLAPISSSPISRSMSWPGWGSPTRRCGPSSRTLSW